MKKRARDHQESREERVDGAVVVANKNVLTSDEDEGLDQYGVHFFIFKSTFFVFLNDDEHFFVLIK